MRCERGVGSLACWLVRGEVKGGGVLLLLLLLLIAGAGVGAGLLVAVQMRLDCAGWLVGSIDCIPRILPLACMLPRHVMSCHAVRCS
jgi:hypothetical protein